MANTAVFGIYPTQASVENGVKHSWHNITAQDAECSMQNAACRIAREMGAKEQAGCSACSLLPPPKHGASILPLAP